MSNLTALSAALVGAGINATVVNQADISLVDTAEQIALLLSPVVSGRVYPLKLPDEPMLPSLVYQPVGREWVEIEGQRLARVDRYLLSLRASSFEELQSLSDSLSVAIASSTAIEITDAAADYEPDQRQYRAHFECDYTTLASAQQQLPAAFIYSLSAEGGDNAYDNAVRQAVTEQVCVVLACPQDDLEAHRRSAQAALVGISIEQNADVLLYAAGNLIDQSGQTTYWREVFSYDRYLRSF